jgi:glycosyltransferase involved in cell wall biosynthesis
VKNQTVLLCSNLYKPNIGGIENSLYHLGQSYVGMGYHVIIVASDITSGDHSFPLVSEEDGMTIYRYQVQKSKSIIRFLNHWFKPLSLFRQLRKKHNPDIVVCRYHQTCLILLLAGFKHFTYLIPGIVKNQNVKANLSELPSSYSQQLRAKFKLKWSSAIQRVAINNVPYVSIFSQNMLEQLTPFNMTNREAVLVTKPGVSLDRFVLASDDKKNQLRVRLGLPEDRKIFLCVGRYVRAKGFALAIEAMRSIDEAFLCIVGGGPEVTLYEKLIDQFDLKDRVKIYPPSNSPELFYAAVDYFLMSSRYEPLGQTILEGLASGLPIVAFDGDVVETATAEIMGDTPYFSAKSLDDVSLSESMREVLALDKEAYQLMAENNRQFALEKFSWTSLGLALEKQLEK